MRIAFLLDGSSRRAFDLARGLVDRGYKVDLVLSRTNRHHEALENLRLFVLDDRTADGFKQGGADTPAQVTRVNKRLEPSGWFRLARALSWDARCLFKPRLIRQIRALACYVKREQPDCVFLNLTNPKSAMLLGCRVLAKHSPVVAVAHSHIKYRRYRYRSRYRRLYIDASQLVGVSQGVSNSLAVAAGVGVENVKTIYNGVDLTNLRKRMEEPPSDPWLLNRGVPIVVTAGRLTGAKDYPTLIKAFARLASQRPCHLIILGEGKARRKLARLIRVLNLTDRISLPGWVDNPFAYMSRASLFVVSSRREGFSMVLLQALACGCPCVSTDCHSGPAEILQNGQYGPLVPVGDDAALAEAMERVLDHPPNKQVLQERATHFSTERTLVAYDQLISTVGRHAGYLSR